MSGESEISLASLSIPDTRLEITLLLPGCERLKTYGFLFDNEQSFDGLLDDAQTLGRQLQAHALELSPIDYVAHGSMREGVRKATVRLLTGENKRAVGEIRDLTLAQICGLSLWLELNNPVVADAHKLRKNLLWHFQTYRSANVTIAADDDCTHYATLVTDAPVSDATVDAALKATPAFKVTKEMRDTFLERMTARMPEVASQIPELKRKWDARPPKQSADTARPTSRRPKPPKRRATETDPRMWGMGAIVLPATQNKVFRFPHERPRMPAVERRKLWDFFQENGVQIANDNEFLVHVMHAFVRAAVSYYDNESGSEKTRAGIGDLSFFLMMFAQEYDHRYWLLTVSGDSPHGIQAIQAEAIPAKSQREAAQTIEFLIQQRISGPRTQH